MKYSYSTNEENYDGEYDSPMEAAIAGFLETECGDSIWVGENHIPSPEIYVTADNVLEDIQWRDAFSGEWAENWPEDTPEQRMELEKELQAVFVAWMDRHKLRPEFWNVEHPKLITREEAQKHTSEKLIEPA